MLTGHDFAMIGMTLIDVQVLSKCIIACLLIKMWKKIWASYFQNEKWSGSWKTHVVSCFEIENYMQHECQKLQSVHCLFYYPLLLQDPQYHKLII